MPTYCAHTTVEDDWNINIYNIKSRESEKGSFMVMLSEISSPETINM